MLYLPCLTFEELPAMWWRVHIPPLSGRALVPVVLPHHLLLPVFLLALFSRHGETLWPQQHPLLAEWWTTSFLVFTAFLFLLWRNTCFSEFLQILFRDLRSVVSRTKLETHALLYREGLSDEYTNWRQYFYSIHFTAFRSYRITILLPGINLLLKLSSATFASKVWDVLDSCKVDYLAKYKDMCL